MNITKENVDDLNALLKVHVEPGDYEDRVEEALKDYKKKANIKGFRPGKVPMGMVRKMVGPKAIIDEVNKVVLDAISKYITNENMNILGEPLLSEDHQPEIDWENQKEFDFVFEIGFAPEININITEKDKIPYYKIKVDEEMINEAVEEYKSRFGEFKNVEKIEGGEMLKGALKEVDETGKPLEDGITNEDATLSMDYIKDEAIKEKFIGASEGEQIVFDPKKAYPNEAELAGLLNIEKEKLQEINNEFQLTINEIKKFEKAEINQEIFDKLFGEGEVTSEKEFREKIKEQLEKQLENDSEYKFTQDAKDFLINKANIELPVEFLKKWLLNSNKEQYTKEQIEEDFSKNLNELKWQVISNDLIKQFDIKVEEQEVLDYAKQIANYQFAQYGMANMPEEQLEQFAHTMLGKEEDRKRMYEKKYQDKLIAYVKENATLNEKEISRDKFKNMLEKENS